MLSLFLCRRRLSADTKANDVNNVQNTTTEHVVEVPDKRQSSNYQSIYELSELEPHPIAVPNDDNQLYRVVTKTGLPRLSLKNNGPTSL